MIPGYVLGGNPYRSVYLGVPDRQHVTTGILYDLVLPLSGIERFDGSDRSKTANLQTWKQIYHELSRASLDKPRWPTLRTFMERADRTVSGGSIPIAVIDVRYNRVRPDLEVKRGRTIRDMLEHGTPSSPYLESRVFAVAALKDYTHRGGQVTFTLDREWLVKNTGELPRRIELDFDDGLGYRTVRFGGSCEVRYTKRGIKRCHLRCWTGDGSELQGGFTFAVEHLQTPLPHDTIAVTATIPFEDGYGTGEAYVYLSDSHTFLENPIVVIEGFDLDNTMNWDELYNLLNQENLVETVRGEGFDVVVLNFTDATDYLQRNAFVTVELLERVQTLVYPFRSIAVVGASMGGLIGRYALAYMETHAIEHRVRTFISFDGPQQGANIPLGIQYWVLFFSAESEEAAGMLVSLNSPAARQMLIYHFTDPPGTTGESDSLRADFLGDLAAVGQYPTGLRTVAIANGSAAQVGQGFAPGDQIIFYEYSSLLVDVTGNVWAVPDGTYHIVFEGLLDPIFLPAEQLDVYIEGTRPLDNAPGGSRASMAQMDSTEAPYGDIIALHESHCFIPTVSALDIDTDDLFYNVAGDPAVMSRTPFDTIYFPLENQEHATITAEGALWFLAEVRVGVTDAGGEELPVPDRVVLHQNVPNPFNPMTTIDFSLPREGPVDLCVYRVDGKKIATLLHKLMPRGTHVVTWNGCDGEGRPVSSGIYFYRLVAQSTVHTRKMVLIR